MRSRAHLRPRRWCKSPLRRRHFRARPFGESANGKIELCRREQGGRSARCLQELTAAEATAWGRIGGLRHGPGCPLHLNGRPFGVAAKAHEGAFRGGPGLAVSQFG